VVVFRGFLSRLSRMIIACAAVFMFTNTAVAACTSDQIDVNGDGTNCQTAKFSVTTTNDATELKFKMSALGTFYVDCGDGGTLTQDTSSYGTLSGKTISRTGTSKTTYTCTWSSGSAHTVKFGGVATGYNNTGEVSPINFPGSSSSSGSDIVIICLPGDVCGTDSPPTVASVNGNISAMFPYLGSANGQYPIFKGIFDGCTNLTSISPTLFNDYSVGVDNMFESAFSGCTGLTSIPTGLFSNITTGADSMFERTFSGCTGLTSIPANLFGGITTGANSMFQYTFQGCTGLTSIPANLFGGITTGANSMFLGTFQGCTGLTSLPSGLFSNITTAATGMFNETFLSCSSLTSIPGNLFSGITTGAVDMFHNTFMYCSSLQSIPAGLFSNITTSANYMFMQTFHSCSSLTSIPAGLFSGITTAAEGMFLGTFNGCSNLSGYIPPTTFAGLIANGHPSEDTTWNYTFGGTNLATSCSSYGVPQYITGYEAGWDGVVSCGCAGGQYLNNGVCTACTNTKPANSQWTVNPTTATCPWECNAGYINTGSACETPKFSVTTTSDTTSLSWTMTALGTFYVDCGDGGTLTQNTSSYGTISGNTITRTSTSATTYTCTWGSADTHTVRFGGTATDYSTDTSTAAISFYSGTQANVASIDGSLGAMFPVVNGNIPRFYMTFYNTPITSIPAGLFSGIDTSSVTNTSYMFYRTFLGTKITSIPAGLFSAIDTSSATNTSNMFEDTFYGTQITSIPTGLFSGIDTSSATNTGGMFNYTFYNCTGLTSIPTGLFSAIDTRSATDTRQMFYRTFYGCTNLSGYIPPNAFPSTIKPGSSSSTQMWYQTFSGTNLATTCPAGTGEYNTGFQNDWGYSNSNTTTSGTYRVSCEPCGTLPANATRITGTCNWTCNAGYYGSSAAGSSSCTICPAGYACSGGVQTNCADVTGANGRATYSNAGASQCTECPAVTGELASRVNGYDAFWTGNIHSTVTGCKANFSDNDPDATFEISCYYNTTDGGYGGTHSACNTYTSQVYACAAGKYNTITSAAEWNGTNYAYCHGADCLNGKICTDVGTGYYSAEGALTRTACPAGTYSNTTSAAACTSCTGATYSAAGASSCTSCPSGYTANTTAGKTANTQCQISVTGGHYIGTSGQTSSNWGTCGAAQYKEPHTVNYGSTSACSSCPSGYTANTTSGKSAASQCTLSCAAGNYMASGTYTQLEYLESTGTQCIDTGIILTSDDLKFEWEGKDNSSGSTTLFGAEYNTGVLHNGDDRLFAGILHGSNSSRRLWTGATRSAYIGYTSSDGAFHSWQLVINSDHTASLSKDGTVVGTQSWLDTTNQYNTIALYCNHITAYFSEKASVAYKYFRITDNGVVVFDGVPVRRNSDSVLGMLDLVSGTFFTNAGTGTFTAGPDVAQIGGTCSAVGSGYYAAASTVNYGSTATRSQCPSGYGSSAAGASADTQCYKACTTANISHSTAVTGNDYYGAGVDTCEPTGCDNGYHVKAAVPDLDPDIAPIDYTSSPIDSGNGTWDVTAPYGHVTGIAVCNTTSGSYGTAYPQYNFEQGTTGEYCWCKMTAPARSAWVYYPVEGAPSDCASYCAYYCALHVLYVADFRSAMFGSVTPEPASCDANVITINWSGASQSDIDANNAGTVTFGGDINTPRAATIIPGKIFRGWKFSKPSGN